MNYMMQEWELRRSGMFVKFQLFCLYLALFTFYSIFKRRIAAARLERSSFCRSKAEVKKREWKAEKAAIKKHQQKICTDVLFLSVLKSLIQLCS